MECSHLVSPSLGYTTLVVIHAGLDSDTDSVSSLSVVGPEVGRRQGLPLPSGNGGEGLQNIVIDFLEVGD